jgi:hypothetical protein
MKNKFITVDRERWEKMNWFINLVGKIIEKGKKNERKTAGKNSRPAGNGPKAPR